MRRKFWMPVRFLLETLLILFLVVIDAVCLMGYVFGLFAAFVGLMTGNVWWFVGGSIAFTVGTVYYDQMYCKGWV